MPIKDIFQVEIINIDKTLRLRKFDYKYDFALQWYQDEKLLYSDRLDFQNTRIGDLH